MWEVGRIAMDIDFFDMLVFLHKSNEIFLKLYQNAGQPEPNQSGEVSHLPKRGMTYHAIPRTPENALNRM